MISITQESVVLNDSSDLIIQSKIAGAIPKKIADEINEYINDLITDLLPRNNLKWDEIKQSIPAEREEILFIIGEIVDEFDELVRYSNVENYTEDNSIGWKISIRLEESSAPCVIKVLFSNFPFEEQ